MKKESDMVKEIRELLDKVGIREISKLDIKKEIDEFNINTRKIKEIIMLLSMLKSKERMGRSKRVKNFWYPFHVDSIEEMYLNFCMHRCKCKSESPIYYTPFPEQYLKVDLGKINDWLPRKLKKNESFFLYIFTGLCKKCKKEKEFYYSVIEKYEPERKKSQTPM